jgi:Skp family chaperone for outer membrane proteins
MKKLTKKEYRKEVARITAEIESVKTEMVSIEAKFEADNAEQADGDKWNSLSDKVWELEQELKFLEQRWSRRNWTAADYALNELVTQNID